MHLLIDIVYALYSLCTFMVINNFRALLFKYVKQILKKNIWTLPICQLAGCFNSNCLLSLCQVLWYRYTDMPSAISKTVIRLVQHYYIKILMNYPLINIMMHFYHCSNNYYIYNSSLQNNYFNMVFFIY